MVYGYLCEAVCRNPGFTGPFDNQADWYQSNVTMTPQTTLSSSCESVNAVGLLWLIVCSPTMPGIQVTSPGCGPLTPPYPSTSFVLPKVVAIKDLPQ